MLKVIVVGTGEMAASLLLGTLEAGHKVVGFLGYDSVSLPLWVQFFKNWFAPSDFRLIAKSKKIYEIKAPKVNSPQFKKEVIKLNADIVLVGSWGERFKKEIIIAPKLGTINAHPSLLPAHRGPNPYLSTIVAGEKTTGVTFHLMTEKYDEGPILLQKEVPILDDDNGYSLKLRCTQTARKALKELYDGIETASLVPIKQDESKASYFKRITNKDIYIDFSMTAREMYNKIRGFDPWACCYIKAKNNFLKVQKASIVDFNDNYFIVHDKKYRTKTSFMEAKNGQILAKGDDWLLCATQEPGMGIVFSKVKLYGFCKQFLTKLFIKALKSFC
ncbi:MAG: methionyl-tRNA formyltransferase [Candidatus Gastranaerophilales bacterium]|nr:methionyl-tRNA formyltransferase [Candidatus Gastranaerophilales bacterium]